MDHPTRARIRKAAGSLFAARGYEATTMNEIADEVGKTKPALYTYFRGKEELFLAVYEELEQGYRQYLEQVLDAAGEISDPQRQLYYVFESRLLYFTRNPEAAALWNRIRFFPPPFFGEKIRSRLARLEAGLQSKLRLLIQRGMNRGAIRRAPVEEVIWCFNCTLEGLQLAMHLDREAGRQKIEAVWSSFWRGIKG